MNKILLMMLAGGCGALSRYLLSGWVQSRSGISFPLGTMVTNVLGCFIFGFLWTMANERYVLSGELAFIVLTGFVGSFTTFSTMTFDAFQLLRSSAMTMAIVYLAGSQLLGIAGAWFGVIIARII